MSTTSGSWNNCYTLKSKQFAVFQTENESTCSTAMKFESETEKKFESGAWLEPSKTTDVERWEIVRKSPSQGVKTVLYTKQEVVIASHCMREQKWARWISKVHVWGDAPLYLQNKCLYSVFDLFTVHVSIPLELTDTAKSLLQQSNTLMVVVPSQCAQK